MVKDKTKKMTAAKERIILSAESLFSKNGFEATSVNIIISTAKVSKGAFYHHFNSKDDLISAIIDFEHSKNPTLPSTEINSLSPEENFKKEISRWFQSLDDTKHLLSWMIPLISHPVMKAKFLEMEPEADKVKDYLSHLLSEINVENVTSEATVLYHFFAGIKFELSIYPQLNLIELEEIILNKYLKNK